MTEIFYINRQSKKQEKEQIPWFGGLKFFYGNNPLGAALCHVMCRFPFFSNFFGNLQKKASSRKRIQPFIKKFSIDSAEFLDPVDSFQSFNDFFIRKLKPSARPITNGNDVAILPADARYLVFPSIQHEEGFLVKGKKFSLEKLLGDQHLAHKYSQGSMVMARLAPVDYHRFHFPCNCIPSKAQLVSGSLYSVNPIALRKRIEIITENKRMITHLKTHLFGTVLFIEIGATYVGSIVQTYEPEKHYAKGDEKGYFSFGGSCILLLFEPFRIEFDLDLIQNSYKKLETLGRMGQSLGRALTPF